MTNIKASRTRLTAVHGWMSSAVIHLAVMLVLALLLAPIRGLMHDRVEITLDAVESPGGELVWLDIESPRPVELPSPALPDGGDTTDQLTIPVPELFASAGGSGRGTGRQEVNVRPGSGKNTGQASFFGTQVTGNEFVYILDVSPSMKARSGQRLGRAKDELLRSIEQLHEGQRFYVIVFGWEARRMFDDQGPFAESIPATEENKQQFREWLGRVRVIPGTDPRPALQIGLSLSADAVFLLSDGEFNTPPKSFFAGAGMKVNELVSSLAKVPIHTIAFEDKLSEPGMHAIAELTQGIHRFVPPPLSSAEMKADEKRAQYWLDRGFKFLGKGQIVQARESFRRILKDHPGSKAAEEAEKQLRMIQLAGVRK